MNTFITAITSLDTERVKELLRKPQWQDWSEPNGKNALHYLCAIRAADAPGRQRISLTVLKLLLKSGLDIDSIHRIDDKNCDPFPATPLWYAYAKGCNPTIYKYLLKEGANTGNCWWAISWYDDVKAGDLWLKHGAKLKQPELDNVFAGSIDWRRYRFAAWLLKHGADVNTVGPDGNTALIVAVKRKDEDAIKLLMSHGADPDRKNSKGDSARSIAVAKGPKRLLALLAK